MNSLMRIRIDAEVLRAHLQREDKAWISEVEILRRLADAGFSREGGDWIVREADLGYLRPEEVTSLEVIANGCTSESGKSSQQSPSQQ